MRPSDANRVYVVAVSRSAPADRRERHPFKAHVHGVAPPAEVPPSTALNPAFAHQPFDPLLADAHAAPRLEHPFEPG
jgi:hypothetical protein